MQKISQVLKVVREDMVVQIVRDRVVTEVTSAPEGRRLVSWFFSSSLRTVNTWLLPLLPRSRPGSTRIFISVKGPLAGLLTYYIFWSPWANGKRSTKTTTARARYIQYQNSGADMTSRGCAYTELLDGVRSKRMFTEMFGEHWQLDY